MKFSDKLKKIIADDKPEFCLYPDEWNHCICSKNFVSLSPKECDTDKTKRQCFCAYDERTKQ